LLNFPFLFFEKIFAKKEICFWFQIFWYDCEYVIWNKWLYWKSELCFVSLAEDKKEKIQFQILMMFFC
jgi:hypothetical protein